jgi:hypothetical protein
MGLIDVSKFEPLTHPHEEGVVVNVRPLRGTEMDEAFDVKVKRTVTMWGATLEVLSGLTRTRDQEDSLQSRMQRYDASTLLKYAIVSWSYEESVTPEKIDNLDAVTRAWLFEEVVKRNTRPLPLSKNGEDSSSLEGFRSN